LALAAFRVTESFPRREWYGLGAQIRRAGFSVSSNIAEGSAKRGSREFRRYLDISIGSLAELAYALLLARDLGLLSRENWERIEALRDRTGMMTWKLYEAVRRGAKLPTR